MIIPRYDEKVVDDTRERRRRQADMLAHINNCPAPANTQESDGSRITKKEEEAG
jgi:hypothetical protein